MFYANLIALATLSFFLTSCHASSSSSSSSSSASSSKKLAAEKTSKEAAAKYKVGFTFMYSHEQAPKTSAEAEHKIAQSMPTDALCKPDPFCFFDVVTYANIDAQGKLSGPIAWSQLPITPKKRTDFSLKQFSPEGFCSTKREVLITLLPHNCALFFKNCPLQSVKSHILYTLHVRWRNNKFEFVKSTTSPLVIKPKLRDRK